MAANGLTTLCFIEKIVLLRKMVEKNLSKQSAMSQSVSDNTHFFSIFLIPVISLFLNRHWLRLMVDNHIRFNSRTSQNTLLAQFLAAFFFFNNYASRHQDDKRKHVDVFPLFSLFRHLRPLPIFQGAISSQSDRVPAGI